MKLLLLLVALCYSAVSSPIASPDAGGEDDSSFTAHADHAIRDTAPLMSESGPMHILMPRHHPDHDAAHLDHLRPESTKSLFFAQTEFIRHITPESRYVLAHTIFKYDAVVLDHSTHLATTVSGKSMNIDFSSPHAFAVARESWVRGDSPFIFVTCSGSSDGHFVYYTVSQSSCHDQNMSCEFTAEVSEFEDIIEGFDLEFGHVKHITKRQATSSQPPSPASTFDQARDDRIGYVNWSPENFAAELHQFAEGLQDTDWDHYQDKNADASGLWNLNDGTIKVGATLPVSSKDFYLTFDEASTLDRRGLFSSIASAIAAAVAAVVNLAKNLVALVRDAAVVLRDKLFQAAKNLVSYVDGTPKKFSRDYSYSFPRPDDPRYVEQSTFKDDGGTSRKAIQLYNEDFGKGKITLYCIDCGIQSSLYITGVLAYRLGNGIQAAQLEMLGTFTASAFLGLDATYDITKKSSQRVFELGIAGLVVPKLITIGPMATVDIETSYFLSAKAAVLAGATMEVKGLSAVIDLVQPSRNMAPNVDVQINPQFTADGQISAGFAIGVPIGIAVGVSLLGGQADAKGSLVIEPSVNVTASASISINQTGIAPQDGSACGGLSLGYYLQNSIYAQAEANLFSLKYASEKKRITEDSKTTLANKCLAPPAQAAQGAAKAAYSDASSGRAQSPPPTTGGFMSDDEHVGAPYVVPAAVQNIATIVPNSSAPTNPTISDPNTPGFNYTIIGDSANLYTLVTTQEGNLGVQPANAIADGNALFRQYGSVVIGDAIGRLMVYYADEAAQYNVSRLRVVADDKVPVTSKAIGLNSVVIDNSALASGLPQVFMVAVDSAGRFFWTAVCSYSDGSPSKIFIIADGNGLATLQSAATNVNVTGPNVSSCQMITLLDVYASL